MKYPLRLDKLISNSTDQSRSEVKKQLKAGHVKVNHVVTHNPATRIVADDEVLLNGEMIRATELAYFMMNKALGVVCDRGDPNHLCAMDVIDGYFNPPLHCAGRLDADTTGLLLLTNDGQWSHQIASPNYHKHKTYLVQLTSSITEEMLTPLREGILLKGETKPTNPAKAQIIDTHQVLLSITEGRYHQVKRMFAAIGNHVIQLSRQGVGALNLDSDMSPGSFRRLSSEEVTQLAAPSKG